MTDPDLARFVTAQDAVLADVEAELAAGHKRSHWMWFVFPQLAGLGRSMTAQHFAIVDLDQARRYLADPALGPRLLRHVRLMLEHKDKSAHAILGTPDDLKFHSCLTLFQRAATNDEEARVFGEAIRQFYDNMPDPHTLVLLDA